MFFVYDDEWQHFNWILNVCVMMTYFYVYLLTEIRVLHVVDQVTFSC